MNVSAHVVVAASLKSEGASRTATSPRALSRRGGAEDQRRECTSACDCEETEAGAKVMDSDRASHWEVPLVELKGLDRKRLIAGGLILIPWQAMPLTDQLFLENRKKV